MFPYSNNYFIMLIFFLTPARFICLYIFFLIIQFVLGVLKRRYLYYIWLFLINVFALPFLLPIIDDIIVIWVCHCEVFRLFEFIPYFFPLLLSFLIYLKQRKHLRY